MHFQEWHFWWVAVCKIHWTGVRRGGVQNVWYLEKGGGVLQKRAIALAFLSVIVPTVSKESIYHPVASKTKQKAKSHQTVDLWPERRQERNGKIIQGLVSDTWVNHFYQLRSELWSWERSRGQLVDGALKIGLLNIQRRSHHRGFSRFLTPNPNNPRCTTRQPPCITLNQTFSGRNTTFNQPLHMVCVRCF